MGINQIRETDRYYEYSSPFQANRKAPRVTWSEQISIDESLSITPL